MKNWIFTVWLLLLCSCSNLAPINYEGLTSKILDSDENFFSLIKKEDPQFILCLERDKKQTILKNIWGESLNFDSGAKAKIVNDVIIFSLEDFFQIERNSEIAPAGIMHVYAYLFSNLKTTYGLKRQRWVDLEVNNNFLFKNKVIAPVPNEGTLLQNVSYFAGMLAFQNEKNKQLLIGLEDVSREIKNFRYSELKLTILTEEITKSQLHLKLLTTIVRFPKKTLENGNDYWLIYSTLDSKSGDEKLITAFPIKKDAYYKMISETELGIDRPILVRYNAYVGQTKDSRFSGIREVSYK
jgi:hypothetical protein